VSKNHVLSSRKLALSTGEMNILKIKHMDIVKKASYGLATN